MIEKRIKNDLTLKRYRKFKKNKLAVVSVLVLGFLFFVSFTAEFWANSKPIVMKYHDQIYFPIVKEYHPTLFGREDIFVMDYRSLEFKGSDWVAWPLIQWDPYEGNYVESSFPSKMTRYNIFGTDDRGRDVLTRLLYGFRYSMIYAIGVWFLTYLFGTIVGSIMGYVGGRTDMIIGRVAEIVDSMPYLLLLITMISIFSPNLPFLIFFTVAFSWTTIAAYMRGQFLQLRKRDYTVAARSLGASHARIIFNHILPNAITPLVTFSPFTIASFITSLSFLDYLGLGLKAPTPSWGELLAQAQKYFSIAEWLVWFPTAALVITLTALITIGLAIRDAFDARA